MKKNSIIIFTAVTFEAKAIAQALHLNKHSPIHYSNHGIALHVIGIRGTHIPSDLAPNSSFILAGLAGALDPALNTGDIVIDSLGHSYPSLQKISLSPHIHSGPITSSLQLVSTPAEKQSLFQTTGALAVEMEAAAVHTALGQIPHAHFLHVRAISDSASENIDPVLFTFIDDFGSLKPAALAVTLLKHPALVPQLNQLGKNSRFAAAHLGQFLQNLLESDWPDG